MQGHPEAVLITGAYGTGKTTVTEELADLLEADGVPYAAIDLDWLAWANVEDGHGEAGERLLLRNVVAVTSNDQAAGMTRFVLAGSYDDAGEIDRLRAAIAMPVRVVRLTAPIEVIERRLGSNPTTGRQHDLQEARRSIAPGEGADVGDLVVDADRPIREVALEILDWLGWTPG